MNEAIDYKWNQEILEEHALAKMGGVPVKANPKTALRYGGKHGMLQQQYFVTFKFPEPIQWGNGKVSELAEFVWLNVPIVEGP